MLTSPHRETHDKTAGFSLLEILVVLAIMSLMLSVVSVRFVSTIESNYFAKTADAAMANILLLRADAVLTSENRIMTTDTSRLQQLNDLEKKTMRRLNLPEGWSSSGKEVFISNTGTCFGGVITITDNEGRRAIYTLTAPKCEVVRAGTANLKLQTQN